MSVPLPEALHHVDKAAAELFDADPAVRSVGVGEAGNGFGFIAVRNASVIVPFAAAKTLPSAIQGIPVQYQNSTQDPTSLLRVPSSGYGSPGAASLVPEQQTHRPLACGLQVQNFDDDVRSGQIQNGFITIGTLGCVVRLRGGDAGVLSNNHVLAGENRGVVRGDRILQAGASAFSSALEIGLLEDFEQLVASPPGASVAAGSVAFNEIDAAVARLAPGQDPSQSYLAARPALPPRGSAVAGLNDRVHKVGRTTGLTYGVVKQLGVIVGPVGYDLGGCWFRNSFVVEGIGGVTFSDRGDSGSAIVRDSDGMVVGVLYAGNGTQTYACPIAPVLQRFNCTVA